MSEQKGWIHDQVAELLSAYIDGEVTSDERGLVEAHLASCEACDRDLATLRQTVVLLRQMPQVVAPRPFTLRESDVQSLGLAPRPARPAWWQSGWLRGAAAAAAMLLCVAVAGVVLLSQRGEFGAPAAPAPVALKSQSHEPAATQAAETAAGARGEAEKQTGNVAPAPTAPAQPPREAAAEPAAPPQPQVAATAAPAAAAAAAKAAEDGAPPMPTASPSAAAEFAAPFAPLATPTADATTLAAPFAAPAAGAAPAPSETTNGGAAGPTASPEAAPEMATQQFDRAASTTATPELQAPAAGAGTTATPEPKVAATMLWEVQDLSLAIEPGVITASGRLPLGRGLRLGAQLLRDGQPTDWTTPATQPIVTGLNGRFFLRLRARAGAPDFDLSAVEPATYIIRIYVVPLGARPGEAHITFSTYPPPTPEPSAQPPFEAPTATLPAPATPTPAPARSAAPTAPYEATPATPADRRRGGLASLFSLFRTGLAVLSSAFHSLRIGSDRRQ